MWQQAWREGRIGFHQVDGNPRLRDGIDGWPGIESGKILVPLCGKSQDLLILKERGHQVVGVEAVEDACLAFFEENNLLLQPTAGSGRQKSWASPGLTLHCCDFLSFQEGEFDAVYDRAALVALGNEVRKQYIPHLCRRLRPGGIILLMTIEYQEGAIEGPPFSVSEDEIDSRFGSFGAVEKILDEEVIPTGGNHKTASLESYRERIHLIKIAADLDS